MPGAIAAVHAVKRRGGSKGKGNISPERLLEMQRHARKKQVYLQMFLKYDRNKNNRLERNEITQMLTDMDTATPPGTKPTKEEVDFVIQIADKSGDGALNRSEFEAAINGWHTYVKLRPKMTETIKKYDKTGNGQLGKSELKAYLTDLNEGHEVSDDEVNAIFKHADQSRTGQLNKTEVYMATSVWYTHVEQKGECCTIL
mmetsp:Transcript_107285/g.189715  ORF Transcript_107285/g.189715 Transcript_107285/m.189715 type:complete len:200 (-) Transcript_107285:105-704(-)